MIQASRPPLPTPPHKPQPRRGARLWAIVLRHRLLIVLGTALGVAAAYVFYQAQVPLYRTTARILVLSGEGSEELPVSGLAGIRETLATQIQLIRSPLVVKDAVQVARLDALPSFAGRGNPAQSVLQRLNAAPVAGSENVLEVTFEGADPRDAPVILNAVVDSYRRFLSATQQDASPELENILIKAEDLRAQLREKEEAYRTFLQQSPLLQTGPAAIEAQASRIAQIETARSQLLIESTALKAQIRAAESSLAAGSTRDQPPVPQQAAPGMPSPRRPASNPANERLIALLLERQNLLEDHGPDHPRVKAVDRQIELARSQLAAGTDQQEPTPSEPALPAHQNAATASTDRLADYLESLRRELATNEEKDKELSRLLEQERAAANALNRLRAEEDTYRREIANIQQLFDGAVRQLNDAKVSRPSVGYRTEVLAAAGPARRVSPNLPALLAVASALGLILSFGFVWLMEATDHRFRSPAEIEQKLGVPILGHIPPIRPTKGPTRGPDHQLDRSLVAFHHPKSPEAEAYRAIRTTIYFHTRDLPHKVIQVTSPNAGEGSSTLAANLAITIAQSGKTVLLLEGDLRTPRVHTLFGFEQRAGISGLLRGEVELRETIRPTPIENLWALPCGSIPINPSELLSTPAFQELVEIARCTFDFVVIDTPPLLTTSDPGVVVERTTGVLLAVRTASTSQADAARALDHLRTLGANVMGLVVNGIDERRAHSVGYRAAARKERQRPLEAAHA